MITLALLATTLLGPITLLEALPNDTGQAFPLIEYKAKQSWYWNGTAVTNRPAHVLAMKLQVAGPGTGGATQVGIPLDMEYGDPGGIVPVKTNWGTGIGDVLVLSGITQQTDVTIHLPSADHNATGDLVSSQFKIFTKFYVEVLPNQWEEHTYSIVVTVTKYPAIEDASIDTRLTYLTGNKGPAVPPPPVNSELQYFNFGSWTYNGGLFAGVIQSPDRSGIGRLQLTFPLVTQLPSNIRNIALSLFMMPVIQKGGGALDLGVYWLEDDLTGLPTEGQQRWDNKWPVVPEERWTGAAPPPDVQFWRKAIEVLNFPAFDPEDPPEQDYACWDVTRGLNYAGDHDISRVVVAKQSEPSSPAGASWRSFASKEYNALGFPFPSHDVTPRLWVVTTGGLTQY